MKNGETFASDIGGVIIDRVSGGGNLIFGDDYLNIAPVAGAFDALRLLVEKRFGNRLHLVSKCGRRVQEKTLSWLEHHRFYELTGIGRANVHFCRERHEKAPICAGLGITHFVDDRLEVLSYLAPTVSTLYLFKPRPEEVERFNQHLHRVNLVNSWSEILARESR